jgi:hypothetical protein
MAYCSCLELMQKKELLEIELSQQQKTLIKKYDANHYTMAPGTLWKFGCSIYT